MRVTVDENLCEANGFCESIAPDMFELGDADVVQIADGPVPPRPGDRRPRRGGPVPQGRAAADRLTGFEASMSSRDMAKYAAMRPYFEVVAEALTGLVDGTDFFDMHAEDVVVEYIITVPDYPRRIVGREALAELYSDYGESIVQSGSSDVYRYYDPEKSVVILEYTMHGTVVSTGAPYVNRFVSVITVKDRKIVHWRDYLDPLAVFAAFGDAPAPY